MIGMKDFVKRIGNKAGNGAQIIVVGGLTGLFAGIVVTLYNMLASMTEEFAAGYYGFFRDHPAFIPLLFLALALGSVVIGGVLKFLPIIRGSGIPQTEGATRGLIRYKWWQVLPATFAASLFTIFMGLSAGSEGPSLTIGGACGYGTSDLLKRNAMVRRYQITGGACAGLAVAFNAPLTGMAFAFEEAHKRFTPEVFICAFSSVIVAVLTRNLLRPLMDFGVDAVFSTFEFAVDPSDFSFYLYVLFAAIVCSVAAVGFYFLLFLSKKAFQKITFFKGVGKMLVPFLAAGAFGLITVYAIGGGHGFISELGSGASGVDRIFSSPLWATLLIVVALKIAATVLNVGAGVPCGIFIPMLAVGAGLGALLTLACTAMGMNPAYADVLIMICMSVFFTTVVKAPITGIVMVVELTWNFTFLLPAILGVAIGYITGDVFRTEPLYDKLLDDLIEEGRKREVKRKITVRLRVLAGTIAAGRTVRDVLWPAGARITALEHEGESIVPDGNSALFAGDVLTVVGETSNEEDYLGLLATTVGELIDTEKE